MSLLLSTKTIIIVSASIGGTFVLAALIGIPFFIVRRASRRQRYSGRNTQQGISDTRWDVNNVPCRETIPRPLSPGRLYRKPSQAASQYPRQSWLLQGLLPSRQNSVRPSDWAVGNGSHVPRPHRLKKSKSTVRPESYLLGIIVGEDAQHIMSKGNSENISRKNTSGRTQMVQKRRAQISTPSGKSHIMSMIITPEHGLQHDVHGESPELVNGNGTFDTLRRSLTFSTKSRSPSKSPINKKALKTPGITSALKGKDRRSMIVPFVPTSEPPSSVVPALPNHTHIPLPRKSTKPKTNNSPSKDSFVSRTTIGSSIFDGLSPSLRNDLEEMTANLKKPESRLVDKRRSSAPSLPTKPFPWSEYSPMRISERKTSGASSQLLPSPAKPTMRKSNNRVKKAAVSKSGISRPKLTVPTEIKRPRGSPERPRVRARDTPITFSGLTTDWNVFGYVDQIQQLDLNAGTKQPNLPISQLPQEGHDTDGLNPQEYAAGQARKPKLLQKKWTRPEDYPPLSFATVAYSSTISLDPPLIMPLAETHRSSMLIIQPQRENPGGRSVTSPESGSEWSQSTSLIALDAAINDYTPSAYPGRGLFGPRRMPSITSRMSTSSPALAFGHEIKRPQSRIGQYRATSSMRQVSRIGASEVIPGRKRYQFEEMTSDEDEEPAPLFLSKASPHDQVGRDQACVDPPPVRLDPTPLRQSFYGYEAVPSLIQYATNPGQSNRQTTGEPAETCLTMPARANSARGFAAPRPPSNLSNSFRLSTSFPATGNRNSGNGGRLSYRASMILSSSPPPYTASNPSRPLSVDSTNMQGNDGSSVTVTPLKHYSHVCDMFPHPLSASSDYSSLGWPLLQEANIKSNPLPSIPVLSSEQRCPSSPRPVARGLPPALRYYGEQRPRVVSGIGLSQRQLGTVVARPIRSTTGKHSPLRRKLARTSMTASVNTQTTPSIMESPPSADVSARVHAQSSQLPVLRAGTPLTLQIVNSLREENSAYKEAHDKGLLKEKVLGQISGNIGAQIPYKGKKSDSRKASERYREMSPSPSPRGSADRSHQVNGAQASPSPLSTGTKSPYGAIGEERSRQIPLSSTTLSTPTQSPDDILKRRFREAKLRKSQASQAQYEPNPPDNKTNPAETTTTTTTIRFTGLGIIIPSSKPSSAVLTHPLVPPLPLSIPTKSITTTTTSTTSSKPIISAMKRKADSTTDSDAPNNESYTAGKRQRPSPLSIPNPINIVKKPNSSLHYNHHQHQLRAYTKTSPLLRGNNRQNNGRQSPLRKVRFMDGNQFTGTGIASREEDEMEGKGFTYRISFREGRGYMGATSTGRGGGGGGDGYVIDGAGRRRMSSSPGRIWREEVF